ncbi:MAG: LysR family transcriptional regulator [Dongiaceae bacterium]
MDLRHLRYFVAAAERGNVSRAAQALHVSQPALSRQIHDLEAELEVALFERAGRILRLTGAGEDLLAYGRRVLEEAGTFRERARAIAAGDAGVLRVGASPQALQRLFPAMIQRFRRLMPGVELRLTEGTSDALMARVAARGAAPRLYQLSAGVQHLGDHGAADPAAVDCGRVAPAGRHDRRPAARGRAAAAAPARTARAPCSTPACRLARIRTNIFLESDATATLLALVKAGCGVAVVPGSVALPASGFHVRRLTRDGKVVEMPTAVHWNPRHFLPPYAERFAAAFAAHARREFAAR